MFHCYSSLTFLLITSCFIPTLFGQSVRQWDEARKQMVQREVYDAGVTDKRVCDALRETPRHLFVPSPQRKYSYFDMALPIGEGQTISPPFIVAYMTEQLDPQPTDKVLEIGTGSGYQAAVLSELVDEVYSIEIVKPLGRQAAATLKRLRYKNVFTKVGDGFQGWAEHAPFDKIILTCSPEKIPKPLFEQLREGGKIVVPLGERYQQALYRFTKRNNKLERELLQATFFVPMTGKAEELREVDSDSAEPVLINGSFEKSNEEGEPDAWYYVRQAISKEDSGSPRGDSYLHCTNAEPGRGSQVLQAVGVDGRKVKNVDVSLWIRTEGVVSGQTVKQLPRLELTFFDEKRASLGVHQLGSWFGTMDWTQKSMTVKVPPKARLAVIMLGMFGAVGEVGFDHVSVKASD